MSDLDSVLGRMWASGTRGLGDTALRRRGADDTGQAPTRTVWYFLCEKKTKKHGKLNWLKAFRSPTATYSLRRG